MVTRLMVIILKYIEILNHYVVQIFKLPYNCAHFMLARSCSKYFKLGFSSIWIETFQMYKLDLEKAEEPEIKLPTSAGSWRKQRNFRKASTSALLTTLRPYTVWITTNCGKFLMRQEYQTTSPVSWENCMQVKKKQLEPDTERSLVLIFPQLHCSF